MIQTDKVISARRPDIVVVDKVTKQCQIIDVAIPGDVRVETKESEKTDKYRDLAIEIKRLWEVKPVVVPVVIGALGTISQKHTSYLASLTIPLSFDTIKKLHC